MFTLYAALHMCFAEVNFRDEYPTTEWIRQTEVDCYVTVFSTVSNNVDISSIKYRISSSGIPAGYGSWVSGAVIVSSDSYQVRFTTSIPNAYGDEFSEGTDNYIQWSCKDKDGAINMAAYNINIFQNETPVVSIIQPKNNGYASAYPLIEAEMYDEGAGIDVSSVRIVLDKLDGTNMVTVSGNENPDICTSSCKIYYQYNGSVLENDTKYRLTISAQDLGYTIQKEGSKTIVFTVGGDFISDLIGYPSPFDPKEENLTIRYVLRENARVTINIYDSARRLVKTVIKSAGKSRGLNESTWNGTSFGGSSLANGIYFCELIAESAKKEYRVYQAIAIFGK